MNREEALKILSLESGASVVDINNATATKKTDLKTKISSAPTDALKAKFQQLLDKVIEAGQVLNQLSEQEPANVKQSASPLSATKMADLPGAAPVGDDASNQTLQPGTVLLDRYEIKQHIAQGGMGAVYRAFDKNRGEDIAIKVMLPQLMQNETARERFLAEARLSSQLSHPNIVNVYDVQQEGDLCFLTMELLVGQDLRELMENRKLARQHFNIEEVIEILSPICAALDHAHEITVHRDIKPENIYLTEDGKYKLMDFGIAQVMSTSQRTQTGAASGTAYYMAPEQLKGAKNIDGRADQYALAVLTYELLSGEVPAGAIEPLHELVKGINKKVSGAVQKALSPRAENRFDTLTEFLAALQGSGKGMAMPALPLKAMGIAAGVVGAIVLVVVLAGSGALNNLSDLLPKSAEQRAAEKAVSIQLQGEVENLKRRLESRRRDLKQQVRDAERSQDSDLWQLEEWQGLTENHIFESNRYAKLNGLEKLSESQIRDKEYPQAEKTLSQIKGEYESLLNFYSAAEKLPVIKEQAKQAKSQWEAYVSKGYGKSDEAGEADASYSHARQQRSDGMLVEAQSTYQQANSQYQRVNQIAQQRKADIASAEAKARHQAEHQAKAKAKAKTAKIRKLTGEIVHIPAGSYMMGTNNDSSSARPAHLVNINAFKMMSKEVTFAQYDVYAKATGKVLPNDFGMGRGNRPVIYVFLDDANGYAEWLSKLTGKRFRLPTEAEWEYACRSGGKSQKYCGGGRSNSYGWYRENSGDTSHLVGQKQANDLGLYDMSGNVFEWTDDCWNKSYNSAPSDGSVWLEGDCEKRVVRGGSWSRPLTWTTSTYRTYSPVGSAHKSVGFRLVYD